MKHGSKMNPLVSVWMVTYNHENYISEALESVLSQKTNFNFEVVIGEDCSTDNTRAIIQDFELRFPGRITPIYHEKNVGPSRNAYEYTLPACKGKYIAVLEGDDFWTNDDKLQKQVDFLEANNDYSACGHQAHVFYEDQTLPEKPFGGEFDTTFGPLDFVQHRKFHTSSLMYRRAILTENGPFPLTVISADRAIFAMLSSFGKIGYLKESMCVYRKGSGGISSKVTSTDLQRDLAMIPWLKKANAKFPIGRLKTFIHLTIYTYPQKITSWHLFKHSFLFGVYSFSYFPKNLGDLKFGITEFFRVLFKKNQSS